jgi:thymidylate synthase
MGVVDTQYANLVSGILYNGGYKYITPSIPGLECTQVTSANINIPLTRFPLLNTKKMDTTSIFEEAILILEADSVRHLIESLRQPSPVGRVHVASNLGFEVIPRPMKDIERIPYAGGDAIYLEGLWEAAYSKNANQEAKNLLDKELESVPKFGFTLKWHQPYTECFISLPEKIAVYATIAYVIGSLTNMVPLNIIGDLSNIHIYEIYEKAIKEQMENSPQAFESPTLEFSENYLIDLDQHNKGNLSLEMLLTRIDWKDFIIKDYKSFGPILAKTESNK